jgi:hypothetical protein
MSIVADFSPMPGLPLPPPLCLFLLARLKG